MNSILDDSNTQQDKPATTTTTTTTTTTSSSISSSRNQRQLPICAVSTCVLCQLSSGTGVVTDNSIDPDCNAETTNNTSNTITALSITNDINEKKTTTRNNDKNYYLLVKRGNAPNQGLWSLPGGKIHAYETSLVAAQRELDEEVRFVNDRTCNDDVNDKINTKNNISNMMMPLSWQLQWHPYSITTSDSIGKGYHYVIAQFFARVVLRTTFQMSNNINNAIESDNNNSIPCLPTITGMDDAADAAWFTLESIQFNLTEGMQPGQVTPGVVQVLKQVEILLEQGIIP